MDSPTSDARDMPRADRERRGRSRRASPEGAERGASQPPKRKRTGHRYNKGGEDKQQCAVCHRWISKCRPAVVQHQSSKYCLSWRFYSQGHPWHKAEQMAQDAAADPEMAQRLVAPVSPAHSPSEVAHSSRPLASRDRKDSRVRLKSPSRRERTQAPARGRSPRSRGASVQREMPPVPLRRPPSRPRHRDDRDRNEHKEKRSRSRHRRRHRRRDRRRSRRSPSPRRDRESQPFPEPAPSPKPEVSGSGDTEEESPPKKGPSQDPRQKLKKREDKAAPAAARATPSGSKSGQPEKSNRAAASPGKKADRNAAVKTASTAAVPPKAAVKQEEESEYEYSE